MEKAKYVHAGNYGYALVLGASSGRAKFGIVDNTRKTDDGAPVMGVSRKPIEFEGQSETVILDLAAEKLAGLIAKKEAGKFEARNVLLVLPDNVAPRFFELQKQYAACEGDADAVTDIMAKDWMSEAWRESISNIIAAYAGMVESGLNVSAMRQSELNFTDIVSTEDDGSYVEEAALKDGKKICVEDGAIVELQHAKMSNPRMNGMFTVVDRSYTYERDGKEHTISRFAVRRWENVGEEDIPARYSNLMAVNSSLYASLNISRGKVVSIEE